MRIADSRGPRVLDPSLGRWRHQATGPIVNVLSQKTRKSDADGQQASGEHRAEVIRRSRRPKGEMADLSAQAQRLHRSLAVAEEGMASNLRGAAAPEMATRAEMIHDELQEELARVGYEMENLARRREYKEMDRDVPECVISGSLLSDTLLEAYCVLATALEAVISSGGSEACARARYKLLGALLVAQDAANAEMERPGSSRGSGPFAANILTGVLKAHKSELGRYNVSVITAMELTLFGTALVVFVTALIAMLLSR